MAAMCKCMLDFYLEDALRQLGYNDVFIETFVINAVPPSDHYVILLKCSFHGQAAEHSIIDPWSEGKAWNYNEGMRVFRTRTPDRYTNSDIAFGYHQEANYYLEALPKQTQIRQIFDHFNIKKLLDSAIELNKPNFSES